MLLLNKIYFCSTYFFLHLPWSVSLLKCSPWTSNLSSPHLQCFPCHPISVTKWCDQSKPEGSLGTTENSQGAVVDFIFLRKTAAVDICWILHLLLTLDYAAFFPMMAYFAKLGFFLAVITIRSKYLAKIRVEQEMRVVMCKLIARLENGHTHYLTISHCGYLRMK